MEPGACDNEPGASDQPGAIESNEGDNDIVIDIQSNDISNRLQCICGQELIQMSADKAYKQYSAIICDSCGAKRKGSVPIFHCMDVENKLHDGGYDLCFECGWKHIEQIMDKESMASAMQNNDFEPGTDAHSEQIQTETLIPICICGEELLKTNSKIYGPQSCVSCDNCDISCHDDDVVYHCMRAKDAPEHKDGFDLCEKCAMKQNKRIRSNWLSDLFEDVIVCIARFVINRRPSSMMRLKSINKYWYNALNPNKANVNALWQYNICRPMFEYIPKSLKIKRWDRYYQYRYVSIMKYRKDHNDQTKINKKLVYSKYKMIENCMFDENGLNEFYRDPNSSNYDANETENENEEMKIEYDGYFEAQIGSHGLPKGYEWKLKCPVLALKLEKRDDKKYYCNVCKKNVWIVENEKEMRQKVESGSCVQYTLRDKMKRSRMMMGKIVRR